MGAVSHDRFASLYLRPNEYGPPNTLGAASSTQSPQPRLRLRWAMTAEIMAKALGGALSTSGLRALDLPKDVRDVIVLADGDAAGEAAARDCSWRWKRQGRRVRIARPPQGTDFNDMLRVGAGQ
jgi:hypothetical protein